MTEPKKPPITAPAAKPKAKHNRTTKNSWQNQKDRPQVARRRGSQYLNPKSPHFSAKASQEAYSNHPKGANGQLICGARIPTGRRCQRGAGAGTEHKGYGICSLHGGNTPQLTTVAARYMGADVIEKMTTAYGYGAPLELSPQEALLQEVRRTGGHVAWLAEQIGFWDMDTTQFITPIRAQWIELYHKEREMLTKVAKAAVDAGVEERKVRLAEQQGAMMLQAFNAVFDALGLSVAQRRLVPQVVPQILRGITSQEGDYQLTRKQKTRINKETKRAEDYQASVIEAELVEEP